jgi:hypothetical protein
MEWPCRGQEHAPEAAAATGYRSQVVKGACGNIIHHPVITEYTRIEPHSRSISDTPIIAPYDPPDIFFRFMNQSVAPTI